MASLPNIRIGFGVPFPASIVGAGPMKLTKLNGVWTVSLDYTQLATHTPPVNQYGNTFVGTYNSSTGLYEKMTLSDMQAATQAGLPCAIELGVDAGGQPVQPGLMPFIDIPFNMTITAAAMMLDKAGSSAVVDVFVCSKAIFAPPTHPAAADKITGTHPLTIVNGVIVEDTTLTGWTLGLNKGDILAYSITSASVATKITASLKGTRNA